MSPDIDDKHENALSLPLTSDQDSTDTDITSRGPTSYTFMWSIPNMIPLSPDQILHIWRSLKGFPVEATYGFVTVRSRKGDRVSIPARILQSAKAFVGAMGWTGHEIFSEAVA